MNISSGTAAAPGKGIVSQCSFWWWKGWQIRGFPLETVKAHIKKLLTVKAAMGFRNMGVLSPCSGRAFKRPFWPYLTFILRLSYVNPTSILRLSYVYLTFILRLLFSYQILHGKSTAWCGTSGGNFPDELKMAYCRLFIYDKRPLYTYCNAVIL